MISKHNCQQSSRLGRLVVEKQWITSDQLNTALKHQQENHCRLGESLVELDLLSQQQLTQVLRKQKWVRSLIAGVVMVTSPICPAFAQEASKAFRFTTEASDVRQNSLDSSPASDLLYSLNFPNGSQYQTRNQHQNSSLAGVEFGVSKAVFGKESLILSETYVPQLTIYASTRRESKFSFNTDWHEKFVQKNRSDRYKDTIPAVYRVTLKGYSVFEKSTQSAKFWSLDKMKGQSYRKYEIMFSVTKRF